MRSSLKMLFTIGLCVSFFPVQAIFASGFTGERGIENLHMDQCKDGKGFKVTLLTAHDNPDVCTDDRVVEVPCDKSDKYYKEPFESGFALFVMAFSEDYLVDVFVNGCNGNGRAKVKTVRVVKP